MSLLEIGKRVSVAGAIVAFVEGQNHLADYVLYPAVILWLGAIKGGTLMTVLGFFANFLIVYWYNKTTQDWFGLEWLKIQQKFASQSKLGQILKLLLSFGKWPAYVGISIYEPAYGFIFLRGRENKSTRFSKEDWWWFVVSNVISNLVWILLVTGVIETIRQFF